MQIISSRKNSKPNSILKASFTIRLTKEDLDRYGPILIDCNFFEKENHEFWVNTAGKEYTNKEGKKKNWNMVRWENGNTQDIYAEMKGLLKASDPDLSESLPF